MFGLKSGSSTLKVSNSIAAQANQSAYNSESRQAYIEGAPHIKHASLQRLYRQLMVEVFENAKQGALEPAVLDLGAGEGSVTVPFLELGARVTAVDISRRQLDDLQMQCHQYDDRLTVECRDVDDFLDVDQSGYDVIVANSFLHHVPDYLSLIGRVIPKVLPGGQFFCFQDPLRYDSLRWYDNVFSNVSFLAWRIWRGDVVGGIKRRLRRRRGIYLENSVHDNAEYHVARNGVDQEAIEALLCSMGFECDVTAYFSTNSRVFQPVGSFLGIKNTFAMVGRKKI